MSGDDGARRSIVIIDDDQDFLEIFSTKLEAAGFTVHTARGGNAGIDVVKNTKPNLVLLDVEMPEMNGAEVLSKLKADPETANINVAFLTNYGEPAKEKRWIDEKFARETGALDYIKKSGELDEIVDEVKTLLGENAEEEE